ncbi:MAG: hypothetical protein ACOX4Z_06470 [Desulfobulbus sp.]|jgi:hypothetical protein
MNDQTDNNPDTAISKLLQRYADLVVLRATVQAIPYIGGSLDTLLSSRAAQIHLERLEKFASDLEHRLTAVESTTANLNDEAFADLMLSTFEAVARTRSDQKRSRFAEIITNQIAKPMLWEEPENAVRLLSDLEDIHIEIITAALGAPRAEEAFSGLRVISLAAKPIDSEKQNSPVSLLASFPHYGTAALRMACAELTAKGLLHDEGIGRWDMGSMMYFVPTDLAEWLFDWISQSHRK